MATKNEKIFYSMGEVAEMLDVNPSLLRFWEKQFGALAPRKNNKGNRLYTPDDIKLLKTIYHLVKERGMTLAGAQKHLKANRKSIERDVEIAERLAAIRALLVEVRNELGSDGGVVDEEPENVREVEIAQETDEVREIAIQEPEDAREPEVAQEPKIGSKTTPEAEPVFIEQTLF